MPALIVWRRVREALAQGLSGRPPCALQLPAMAAMALVWSCGEAVGYFTARPVAGLTEERMKRARGPNPPVVSQWRGRLDIP